MRFVGTILRELSWELPLKTGSKYGILMRILEKLFRDIDNENVLDA